MGVWHSSRREQESSHREPGNFFFSLNRHIMESADRNMSFLCLLSEGLCSHVFSKQLHTGHNNSAGNSIERGLDMFPSSGYEAWAAYSQQSFFGIEGVALRGGIKPSLLSHSDSKGDHVSFFFINAQRYSRFLCPTPIPFPSLLPLSPHYSLCSGNELRTMDIRVKMRFTANFQRYLQDSLLDSRQHSASPL